MTTVALLSAAILFAEGCVVLGMVLCALRLLRGPTAQDRVLALDTLWMCAMILALVLVHVGAIVFYAVVKKEDLVRPMVTGYRRLPPGVQDVPRSDTKSYGIVDARPVAERLEQVHAIVEKPKPEEAPSTLGVVGRYILTPRIFHHLENVTPGSGGEIQLTDGIASMLREEQVLAYRYYGTRYDCGSKLGYLQATVEFGRRHPEVGGDFTNYLKHLGEV